MIKTFIKLGIAEDLLNLIKRFHNNPTPHIILDGKRLNSFP